MKLFKLLIITFIAIFIGYAHIQGGAVGPKGPVADLQISDEELKALGLSEAETSQFKELVDSLQNLPPEDLKFLEELGQQLENEMRTQGLDPSNPDDVFKWVDKQEPAEEKTERPSRMYETLGIDPIKLEKKEFIQITTPVNAQNLLQETSRILDQIRLKASNNPKMHFKLERWSQELNQLQYYLNILAQPELLKHFTSKDFEGLYKKVEKLHTILSESEPLIIVQTAPTAFEDSSNPYETLRIPYRATQEQINQAFENLSKEYDPQYLSSQFEAQGIAPKTFKRKIKEASLIFTFIKDAYEVLSDPKLRTVLDKSLKEEIEQSRIQEISSMKEFDNFLEKLSKILYDETLLKDIEKLLEKYKVEEIALAKTQDELVKKVYQRAEQRQKLSTSPQTTTYTSPYRNGDYDTFYRELDRTLQRTKYMQYPVYQPQQVEPRHQVPGTPKDKPLNGQKAPSKDAGKAPGKDAKADKKADDISKGDKLTKPN